MQNEWKKVKIVAFLTEVLQVLIITQNAWQLWNLAFRQESNFTQFLSHPCFGSILKLYQDFFHKLKIRQQATIQKSL